MVDITKLAFWSQLNYMKRSDFFGLTTATFGSAGSDVAANIAHNLGYVPFFIAGVDLFNNGVIWSNNYVHEYTESSGFNANSPASFYAWCTASILTVDLRNGLGTGAQSGSRNIYYGVYLDYA